MLTFVDTRWYTLMFVSSTVKCRFQFVEEGWPVVVRTVGRSWFVNSQSSLRCGNSLLPH